MEKDMMEDSQLDRSIAATKTKVLVVWHDARFYPDTRDETSIQECRMQVFEALGYLMQCDDVTTIIASEYNDEGECRDVTLIPTGSILEMKELLLGANLETGRLPNARPG